MEVFEVLVLVITFVFFIIIGVPIAYCIGLAGIITMLLSIDYLPAVTTFAQRMATGLDSFTLLAIPLFILAGQLMNTGGIATRLIEFAKVIVGRLPGGLAVVNILANMLFGAISGSAGAAASAIGTIMHPRMKKEGYDENFSAAVNISSATTGLVIPPSNILIIYSLASGGVSIAALFLAGYIPGVLTGIALIGFAAAHAYRHNYPTGDKVPLKEGIYKLLAALPSLLLLVIILGGIVAGIFTATEASGVAVIYCLILAFIYREISWSDLPGILIRTSLTTCIVLLMVASSIGLSWVMAYQEIPQNVSAALLQLSDSPFLILLIINIILLFVGVFMDMTPAVLIFTPIFLPVVTQQLGIDPVHFGIILIMNLCVGLCTPPVGTVLFIGCSVANIKIQSVIRPLLPLFIAMIIVLLLVTYIPEISLWLPRQFGF
ncbi:tripartite ATP-independent transporter DctM subunit [Catalinimonas alkaloidigena]|uniref:TRAP transporter large permease n=1 Tax=Catalinimonas alkaloidigena TaxID=1075417 RepID=UPI0024075C0F|nr:TRAP transporter large permease [Catalinimonas alkaloidigena]MDF9799493.1 tripartite ATP-independent transporter DctM subunit [Catalinimonas alkaloidigena]